MLRKLIGFALILYVAMPTLAQAEFDMTPVDYWRYAYHLGNTGSRARELVSNAETVAEYLYLTQKDDYCTSINLYAGRAKIKWLANICVFYDPRTKNPLLYLISEPWSVADYIVLYNGRIVYVPRHSGKATVPNLRSGDYEVYIVGGTDTEEVGWQSVTFNIPEPQDESN